MLDRRSLLKFFGLGAVIVPAAQPNLVARVIEPPKVELFKPEPIINPSSLLMGGDGFDITITLRDRKTGQVHIMRGDDISMESHRSFVDVTQLGDSYHRYLPALADSRFTVTGRIVQ